MRVIRMYDAASAEGVNAIPADAQAVAGYIDGRFRTFPLMVKRFFPHAHCVSIGVEIGHLAEWSDVEPGNPINTPALVRDDFERRKAHGVWKPGFYADRSDMESIVIPGLSGIPRSEYRLWVANPDRDGVFTPSERAEFEAVQDFFNPLFDVSLVNVDRFFPKGQAPKKKHHIPKPNPVPYVKKASKKVHPKVKAAGAGGGVSVGIAALLSKSGVKLSPAEWTAIGTIFTTLAAAAKGAGGK